MEAKRTTSKNEIVSKLFNLGFYKNQKEWKFCSEQHPRKNRLKKTRVNPKLDKTYNIGSSCVAKAIEPESGDIKTDNSLSFTDEGNITTRRLEKVENLSSKQTQPVCLNCPLSPKWSIEDWKLHIRQKCTCAYKNSENNSSLEDNNDELNKCIPIYTNSKPVSVCPSLTTNLGRSEEIGESGYFPSYHDQGWPKQSQSQMWVNEEQHGQDHKWSYVYSGDTAFAKDSRRACQPSSAGDAMCEMQLNGSFSSVSSEEFVRGAAVNPHSSEIELWVPESEHNSIMFDMTPSVPGYSGLNQVSQTDIVLAVSRYNAARENLESRLDAYTRAQLPVPETYREYPNHEAPYPIHETPYPLHSRLHFPSDPCLSGSSVPREGRGRGRLTDRVIGIRNGRPYRLK